MTTLIAERRDGLAAFQEPLVRRAAVELEGAPAEEILRWALDRGIPGWR